VRCGMPVAVHRFSFSGLNVAIVIGVNCDLYLSDYNSGILR
jgi:hypothetical protein